MTLAALRRLNTPRSALRPTPTSFEGARPLHIPATVVVLVIAVMSVGMRHLCHMANSENVLPFVSEIDVSGSLIDLRPVTISVAVAGTHLEWHTTVDAVRTDRALWRRMTLADWNSVADPLRSDALDRMLARYRAELFDPSVWDKMNAGDWDRVPQPIRTVAFRQMIAYWSGYYGLGRKTDAPAIVVSETLAAVVMSESWFDHRASALNRDGTRDVGLGGASEFARERLPHLHRLDLVDTTFTENDLFNPWLATRFAAIWMGLMLDEAGGDLDKAVRAYNCGMPAADHGGGMPYLETVRARLYQFIQNRDAPVAWSFVWRQARNMERAEWPWMARSAGPGSQSAASHTVRK